MLSNYVTCHFFDWLNVGNTKDTKVTLEVHCIFSANAVRLPVMLKLMM